MTGAINAEKTYLSAPPRIPVTIREVHVFRLPVHQGFLEYAARPPVGEDELLRYVGKFCARREGEAYQVAASLVTDGRRVARHPQLDASDWVR
ncbi:hypothetical protein [Streptomyces mirabilis]|uniref:hypothetical protein n=1 Tax=Streptomyces mirabilis TaxID=68239 RepID=UPI003687FBB5